MSMTGQHHNQLLVEGQDDKYSVINLMKHHVNWPGTERDWPVTIDVREGVDNILDQTFLSTKMKESDLKILGVIIDADYAPSARWGSLKNSMKSIDVAFPDELGKDGLIFDLSSGIKFGFWLMPDCSSEGALETFLSYLIPKSQSKLWGHTESAFTQAKNLGAACLNKDTKKAHIHTWLAWQNPPGRPFGAALTRKILDPCADTAKPFVEWFKKLYNLS